MFSCQNQFVLDFWLIYMPNLPCQIPGFSCNARMLLFKLREKSERLSYEGETKKKYRSRESELE